MKLLAKLFNLTDALMKKDNTENMLKAIKERALWLGITVNELDLRDCSARFGIERDYHDEIVAMTIDVRPSLTLTHKIVAIAHELGHAWQFLGECEGIWLEWHVYNEINSDLIIEEDAWVRSVRILHQVEFTDWVEFKVFAAKSFATYVCRRHASMSTRKTKVENFVASLDGEIANVIKEVVHV